jgi:hypothetical protein
MLLNRNAANPHGASLPVYDFDCGELWTGQGQKRTHVLIPCAARDLDTEANGPCPHIQHVKKAAKAATGSDRIK